MECSGLAVKFNQCDTLAFTQGDGPRQFACVLYDPRTALQAILAGSTLSLNFPRQGGGSVKRSTAPIQVAQAAVIVPQGGPPGYISLPDNGLCDGDKFQLTTSGTLPTPLALATNYLVETIDNDTFYLTDLSGNIIQISDQGSGGFTMTSQFQDIVVSGTQFLLNLRSSWSLFVNAALAQTPQLSYTDPSNNQQIVIIRNQLDVFAQPVP
jgi:hypothetical protein